MSTVHANDTRDALDRLELMIALSGVELPTQVARQYIASALDILVHITRMSTGERKIVRVSELGRGRDGNYSIEDIFVYRMSGIDKSTNRVQGAYYATGYEPEALRRLASKGIDIPKSLFTPRELKVEGDASN
jgi:pilus assembly protein CpaF